MEGYGGLCMNYELKHYDLSLVHFSATEDNNTPEIKILWVNETKKTAPTRPGINR